MRLNHARVDHLVEDQAAKLLFELLGERFAELFAQSDLFFVQRAQKLGLPDFRAFDAGNRSAGHADVAAHGAEGQNQGQPDYAKDDAGHPTAEPVTDYLEHRSALTRRMGRVVAEWTGLEPATTGLTARYSNHLNYHSAMGAEGLEPPTFAV